MASSAALLIHSPYDPEARYSTKRQTLWVGYKVHPTETCEADTTHLAARMEQRARPRTTLLTGDTLRLVEGYVEVNPLGPVRVKGLPEPIEVYELRRAGPQAGSRADTGALGTGQGGTRAGGAAQRRSGHRQITPLVSAPDHGQAEHHQAANP